MAMPDITDEKLALIEYDESEASYDDIAAIIARLRKAEAELAAAKAHNLVLRRALEEIRDEDDGRFKDMVPCLSLKSRGVIDRALRVTAPRAETEGSDA